MNQLVLAMRRSFLRVLVCGFLLNIGPATLALAGNTGSKGLSVRNGILTRKGQPYRGIGANYDTLFSRIMRNKDDTSSLENLARLGRKGIPFVRFRACGFSPDEQALYLRDPAEFFRRLDIVVRCAEENGVGLIPSLFWRLATVEELVNEPPDQVGNPNSRISRYIRQFTRDLVTRYKDSPAIWGWEFGNEANLATDLPGGGRSGLIGIRRFGLPTERAAQTRLNSDGLRTAYKLFARTVRAIDSTRFIESGDSLPRKSAWHNARGQFWQPDNTSQYAAALLKLSPAPMDMISAHVYPKAQALRPTGTSQTKQIMALLMQTAAESRKPLFLGEFPTRNRAQAEQFLQAIVSNRVPLSAFWVFDNKAQEATMSVSFTNRRAFVLDLVAQANKALAGDH